MEQRMAILMCCDEGPFCWHWFLGDGQQRNIAHFHHKPVYSLGAVSGRIPSTWSLRGDGSSSQPLLECRSVSLLATAMYKACAAAGWAADIDLSERYYSFELLKKLMFHQTSIGHEGEGEK